MKLFVTSFVQQLKHLVKHVWLQNINYIYSIFNGVFNEILHSA